MVVLTLIQMKIIVFCAKYPALCRSLWNVEIFNLYKIIDYICNIQYKITLTGPDVHLFK